MEFFICLNSRKCHWTFKWTKKKSFGSLCIFSFSAIILTITIFAFIVNNRIYPSEQDLLFGQYEYFLMSTKKKICLKWTSIEIYWLMLSIEWSLYCNMNIQDWARKIVTWNAIGQPFFAFISLYSVSILLAPIFSLYLYVFIYFVFLFFILLFRVFLCAVEYNSPKCCFTLCIFGLMHSFNVMVYLCVSIQLDLNFLR